MLCVAHLEAESDSKTRAAVLQHLYAQCSKVSCNRNVRLVRCWHGMKANNLLNVLEGGFAAIATLDEGLLSFVYVCEWVCI